MTEPAFLRTTRAAYDTVAVDYAKLLRTELAGSHWTVPCLPRSPNSCGPPMPGRSPISVAAPDA